MWRLVCFSPIHPTQIVSLILQLINIDELGPSTALLCIINLGAEDLVAYTQMELGMWIHNWPNIIRQWEVRQSRCLPPFWTYRLEPCGIARAANCSLRNDKVCPFFEHHCCGGKNQRRSRGRGWCLMFFVFNGKLLAG